VLAGATSAAWASTAWATRPQVAPLGPVPEETTTHGPTRLGVVGAVRPWAKELTVIFVLYGLWQYAGAWSVGRAREAMSRGRTIWHVERALHLPNERTAQRLVLHHHYLVRLLNEFYAYAHVPAFGICLVWLFVRHRDRYPAVRTAVALVTGGCLVIQLFPVAPPRLLPQLGMVDTGALIGPSDYSSGAPGIDQLSAMPSVHVAWALLAGVSVVLVARSSWRWLALAHPGLTVIAVTVTGNHYWADSIVAAALCAVAAMIVTKVYRRPSQKRDDLPPSPSDGGYHEGRRRAPAVAASV